MRAAFRINGAWIIGRIESLAGPGERVGDLKAAMVTTADLIRQSSRLTVTFLPP
jgi:hypothetical protein